jgi:hypothetical protein
VIWSINAQWRYGVYALMQEDIIMTVIPRRFMLDTPQTRPSTFRWPVLRPLLWTGAAVIIGLIGPFLAWLVLG